MQKCHCSFRHCINYILASRNWLTLVNISIYRRVNLFCAAPADNGTTESPYSQTYIHPAKSLFVCTTCRLYCQCRRTLTMDMARNAVDLSNVESSRALFLQFLLLQFLLQKLSLLLFGLLYVELTHFFLLLWCLAIAATHTVIIVTFIVV